jgi:integrating conjugative element protein (TIGR03749 family)
MKHHTIDRTASRWEKHLLVAVCAASCLASGSASAQQVLDIQPSAGQPALILPAATGGSKAPAAAATKAPASSGSTTPLVADVDLGQATAPASSPNPASRMTAGEAATAQAQPAPGGVARRAAAAMAQGTPAETLTASTGNRAAVKSSAAAKAKAASPAMDRPGIERAVFARLPVRVGLPVLRERLITLPGPAALHVPGDIDSVARVEAIDRTIYVTALVPFAPIRIVAELIDGGQQIPLDLVANAQTSAASAELEVFLDKKPASGASGASESAQAEGTPSSDMVELTRYASRMLYAPRRLAGAKAGIQQVQVSTKPVPGLVRGGLVESVPLGQWRSAGLYVTAVRVTNKSAQPFELPLEHLRGRWLAVTAQHGRIGPAGSETDTTALYLICDRAFDACL